MLRVLPKSLAILFVLFSLGMLISIISSGYLQESLDASIFLGLSFLCFCVWWLIWGVILFRTPERVWKIRDFFVFLAPYGGNGKNWIPSSYWWALKISVNLFMMLWLYPKILPHIYRIWQDVYRILVG